MADNAPKKDLLTGAQLELFNLIANKYDVDLQDAGSFSRALLKIDQMLSQETGSRRNFEIQLAQEKNVLNNVFDLTRYGQTNAMGPYIWSGRK